MIWVQDTGHTVLYVSRPSFLGLSSSDNKDRRLPAGPLVGSGDKFLPNAHTAKMDAEARRIRCARTHS